MIAQALADAFLVADLWTVAALEQAGFETIGTERAAVGLAVRAALQAYPRAPHDAPRQLAAVIAQSTALTALVAARDERRPIRVLTRRVGPVRARPVPTSPLLVDTLGELARALDVTVGRLLWLADSSGWNRGTASAGPLAHYRYEWIARPGRTPRLLEKPLHRLKSIQRLLVDDLLGSLPLHEAAHGFVAGRSAVTGAERHTGQEAVVSADLTSFFASVSAPTIYGVFRRAGFAEPLARALTGICTHRVPVDVLSHMPPGGSSTERFALRQALAVAHLPQGAPSSPALANLSLRHLDARLAGWAEAAGATYTRYADDLAFSGGQPLASRADAFLRGVERITRDQGLSLNGRKTRVRRQGVRQSVTGVIVNDRTSAGRREFDTLKAILHNCERRGPIPENRQGHEDFRAYLSGRVGWFELCNPQRGARLRASLDRINWGATPGQP